LLSSDLTVVKAITGIVCGGLARPIPKPLRLAMRANQVQISDEAP